MEKAKELFQKILQESLDGNYEHVLTPEKAGVLVQELQKIGKDKTTLNQICDGNILAAMVASVIVGDVLVSLNMSPDVIPAAIAVFLDSYSDDMYLLLGSLALASELGLTFDGVEFVPKETKQTDEQLVDDDVSDN